MQPVEIVCSSRATRQGWLALPSQPGPRPAVVVIHDITGMRADTRRHCARFAEEGYVALAPDLYDGGSPRCVVGTLTGMLRGRGEAFDVIRASRELLAARPDVDAARIGVVGFCMGGGFALLAAADDAFAVAAPFYGTVPRSADRLSGLCPTIAQFGAQDLVFRRSARRLKRHLEQLDVPHAWHLREGVGHSFMNDHPDVMFRLSRFGPMRAGYDAETESEAWGAMLAFFSEHLGASPPAQPAES